MIPILIGAAVASAAAYKFFEDNNKKIPRTETRTRYLSEEEVPPDILEKIRQKELARKMIVKEDAV